MSEHKRRLPRLYPSGDYMLSRKQYSWYEPFVFTRLRYRPGAHAMPMKFRLSLPIINLLAAVALLLFGRHTSDQIRGDFPFSPTPVLICKAINAPAALWSLALTSTLPLQRHNRAPVSVSGFGAEDAVFLLGVIVLWYLLGRAIDRQGIRRHSVRQRIWVRLTLNAMLALFGVALFLVGVAPLFYKRGLANPTVALISSSLYVVWSLVLFLLAIISLIRIFQTRNREEDPAVVGS
jgi:hypothetical protein